LNVDKEQDNMHSFTARYVAVAASLIAAAKALNGIVVPDSIRANTAFNATFLDQNSDTYRVYLAAALGGGNGPTCTPSVAATRRGLLANKAG